MSHPRTGSSAFTIGFIGTADHELRFRVSNAFAASCAVVISVGSLSTVAEYQKGRVGASGAGNSPRETVSDTGDCPSINSRTCPNSDQPISSSVLPLVMSRRVSSQREPNFVADSTAAPKGIERAEHPQWLSNAFLVAERPGGKGVLIDGNGVNEPLLAQIERDAIEITHILLTHHHMDHVVSIDALKARFGVPVVAHALTASELPDGLVDEFVGDDDVVRSGSLEFRALFTPGHAAGHIAFLVDGECFTADVLFAGTLGGNGSPGGNFDDLKRSVMERLMALPPETRVHPGHCHATTIGTEWDENPFIRVWRGLDAEGDEACVVRGAPATLLLWGPDYDGTNKALVRFAPGHDTIIGGSQVERRGSG